MPNRLTRTLNVTIKPFCQAKLEMGFDLNLVTHPTHTEQFMLQLICKQKKLKENIEETPSFTGMLTELQFQVLIISQRFQSTKFQLMCHFSWGAISLSCVYLYL